MKQQLTRWAMPIAQISAFAGSALFAHAQQQAPTPVQDLSGIVRLICTLTNWIFTFFILIAIIFVIWAGFKYLTAGGDAEKVKSANHQIIYALVALVIALVARGVPFIVSNFVGGSNIGDVC